ICTAASSTSGRVRLSLRGLTKCSTRPNRQRYQFAVIRFTDLERLRSLSGWSRSARLRDRRGGGGLGGGVGVSGGGGGWRAGPVGARGGTDASCGDVRAGHRRQAGRPVLAGEHEVGVPVAARLAGRRRVGPGLERPWRECLPAG